MLFVSERNSPPHAVFKQEPDMLDGGTAPSLAPVAWSSDGRWLLVERGEWYFASDAGGLGVLVYDNLKHSVSTPDVLGAIARRLRRKCSLNLFELVGFDHRNRVLIRVGDAYDEEGRRESSCATTPDGTAPWSYNLITGNASPAVSPK